MILNSFGNIDEMMGWFLLRNGKVNLGVAAIRDERDIALFNERYRYNSEIVLLYLNRRLGSIGQFKFGIKTSHIIAEKCGCRSLYRLWAKLPHLRVLVIRNSSLRSLSFRSYFPTIEYIDVSNNHIRTVDLSNAQNVKILILSGNKHIESIRIPQSVEYLDISSCGIKDLGMLPPLPNLKYLKADNNELTELDLSPFPNLRYISAVGNRITFAKGLGGVTYAKLSGNALKSVEIKSDCDNIELYDFSDNPHLERLQIDVKGQIKRLLATSCSLSEINISAEYMYMVDLSRNRIRTMKGLSSSYILTLFLDDNEIEKLEDLPADSVFLRRNKIRRIAGDFGFRILGLDENLIETVLGFKDINLESLSLSKNPLISIEMTTLPSLTELILNEIFIRDFIGMYTQPSLEYISFEDSRITSFKFFPSLPRLRTIYVNGATIETLFGLSYREIQTFLFGLNDTRILNEFDRDVLIHTVYIQRHSGFDDRYGHFIRYFSITPEQHIENLLNPSVQLEEKYIAMSFVLSHMEYYDEEEIRRILAAESTPYYIRKMVRRALVGKNGEIAF